MLSWPTKEKFEERIIHADMIEGDQYERKIVEVSIQDGTKHHAYIYISKSPSLDNEWKVIPSGDWLERHAK